jgi:hypothetical protein
VTDSWKIAINVAVFAVLALMVTRETRVLSGAAMIGLAAWALARELGAPAWRDWQFGDASDIGLLTFIGIVWLAASRA